MSTRVFTRAELAALGVPPDSPEDVEYSDTVLADEPVTTLKYSQKRRCIVRPEPDGPAYAVEYEAQLDTGDYELGPGPDNHGWWGDEIEGVPVQERPVIVRSWVPVTVEPGTEPAPVSAVDSLVALYEEAGAHAEAAREAAAAWIVQYGDEVAELHDDYVIGGEA
jgi:hypothetical protein